jgi:hypothetical protein
LFRLQNPNLQTYQPLKGDSMKQAELLNEISKLARQNWGDNAVEALVGLLSTVVTDAQLQALVEAWGVAQ